MISKGADVNVSEKWGFTLLHLASIHGNTEITKLLLENGADVNATNSKDETALDLAEESRHSNEEVIKLLKAHGAKRGSELDKGKGQ